MSVASDLPFDITDPVFDIARPGMRSRIKHRVILVRHGESDANVSLMSGQAIPAGQLNLSCTGHEQAQDIAKCFKKHSPVTKIESSPLLRAWDTAQPTIKLSPDATVEIFMDLREIWRNRSGQEPYECIHPIHQEPWIRYPDSIEDATQRIINNLDRWKSEGSIDNRKQTVVFTHSIMISGILNIISGTPLGNVTFHVSNGSLTCFDIDENDQFHVHFVNYTEHLHYTLRTGHHTSMG